MGDTMTPTEKLERLREQKLRWYHDNKDWANPKRNQKRHEERKQKQCQNSSQFPESFLHPQ